MGRPQLGFPRLRVLPGKATALAIAPDDTPPSPIPHLGILAGRRKACEFGSWRSARTAGGAILQDWGYGLRRTKSKKHSAREWVATSVSVDAWP